MMSRLYPPCPAAADVFWDNGHWVAIITDPAGTRRNVAGSWCQTKRDAILEARGYLGMEVLKYESDYG